MTEETQENIFDLVEKLSLYCDNGNEKPITLFFFTEEYEKDIEGGAVPTKCDVKIFGNIASDEDRAVAKLFRAVYARTHRYHKWYHSKKAWYKTHHDLIVMIFNIYNKYKDELHLKLKIKSVDVKGSKDNYLKICEYFKLISEEGKENA